MIPAVLLRPLLIGGAMLVLAGGLYACGRQAARDAYRADALESEQATRRKADEAASAAQRDGAAVRLRDGRF